MARCRSLILLAALLIPSAAGAQGLIIAQPIPGPRPIPAPAPRPLPIQSEKISLDVESGAVRAQVAQVFRNPASVPLEGTYLFNLPEGAAVSNFRMQVGNEPVDGKMLSVDEARRIYEQFVRQRIDPGILEYVGRNAFRARVFPIPPSADKEIQIGYAHPAGFQNGLYQITYPLNTEKVSSEPLKELSIRCVIRSAQPIKAIYSPTHEIQVRRDNDHLATVTFDAKDARANRDFVLYYSVSDREFGLNTLANRQGDQDGYFMMMLAPRRETSTVEVLPKDIVFVFDTSGSMQGPKIEQAKRALNTVLGALGPHDRFNVLRFSTDVASFKERLVLASAENVKEARDFVSGFKAVGGTAIDDALQAAFASMPAPEGAGAPKRAGFVIFMTDGLPTSGQTNLDQILTDAHAANKTHARFFAFGVGNDVNALLLDRLALNGSGAADYVGPDEDLETKIGGFYAKIANPVLSNVKVAVDGVSVKDLYPNRLPDLFAGTQLLLLGRYKGAGKATVRVSGDMGGVARTYTYDVTFPAAQKQFEFVPKLWASRKIGFLLEEIRLHGETAEVKDEVIRLSKEYGIITPYTSFLVEEPGQIPGVVTRSLGIPPQSNAAAAMPGGGFGRGGFGGSGGIGGGLSANGSLGQMAGRAPSGEVSRQLMARRRAGDRAAFGLSTGRDAIGQSQRLRQLKEQSVDEMEVESIQTIGGRRFEQQQGVWQDAEATGRLTVVPVKYGSDAYFQLVNRSKDWARFMALGKNVTFRTGKTHAVKISETAGKEKLTDAELKALEQ